jgi:hypothetical protein
MKVKTSELEGVALDFAVAVCEGIKHQVATSLVIMQSFTPSSNWAQGGSIIERERLEIRANDYSWQAYCFSFPTSRAHKGVSIWADGPTPLTAAMRCYVASKLGGTVEVPDELI